MKLIKRLALSTVAAGTVFGTAFAPSALASDPTSATVTGGSLSITNPAAANFVGSNITGIAQTTTAALATFAVSDLTGSGAGWHVTAEATQFDGVNHDLAVGSLLMSQPTVDANGTTSPDPGITGAVPYVLDGGEAALIASAAEDEGMGKYDFSATTLTLALPADVFADVYASSVTVSVITAP